VSYLSYNNVNLAGRGIGIICKAGLQIRSKKEAGCGNFAYERELDFIILMSGIRDSDF